MNNIDWAKLGEAVEFYKAHGFEYVETPWYIDYESVRITCDIPANIMTVDIKSDYRTVKGLVGSAEQGFLQLAIDGKLKSVNYVSCGPCFRDEETSEFHQKTFMKVELFSRCNSKSEAKHAAKELRNRAKSFMGGRVEPLKTKLGWDLLIDGIEVGSYGARYHETIGWWAYGTGLAEPRYSTALKKGTKS